MELLADKLDAMRLALKRKDSEAQEHKARIVELEERIAAFEARERERRRLEEREWLERQREREWERERDQEWERQEATVRALAHRTKQLAAANGELEEFARVVSHDLQAPLVAVGNYAGLLGRRYAAELDEDAKRFVGHVTKGVGRMQEMLGDLLSYCRVENWDTAAVPVALDDVLESVTDNLRFKIDRIGAEITCDALPLAMGIRSQLAHVFQNLIGNALKFRREEAPPRIHIGVAADRQSHAGEICLEFRDNGIGIPEKGLQRIFQVFRRLHPEDRYPGTGIGLAICKKIAERHGGRIWVESEEGVGSSFFLTLSEATSHDIATADSIPGSGPITALGGLSTDTIEHVPLRRSLRILHIEDNDAHAEFVHDLLYAGSDVSFEVYRCRSLGELAAHSQTREFDVVVTDLELPDSEAMGTIDEVRTRFPESPVIILSSHHSRAVADRAHDAGIRSYLLKPRLDKKVLIRAIRSAGGDAIEYTGDYRASDGA